MVPLRHRSYALNLFSDLTFKARSKLKQLGQKKRKEASQELIGDIQLTWIIWLKKKDHLEMIYKGLTQKQQQQAYFKP